MLTVGNTVLVDSTVTTGQSGDIISLYSPQWIADEWGEFIVRLTVDTLDQIDEGNEVNNIDTAMYVVLPPNPAPEFQWITPGDTTLIADSSVTLRWFLSDPEEPAWVSLYYGISPVSCTGTGVPGGADRPSLEGVDSLTWDVRFLPNHRTYYLYAVVYDSENDSCIYAPWPMFTCHGCLGVTERDLGLIPETYFLAQNYPNPFNPVTEIRYGVTVPGHVTLRVFDLLGRVQSTLVDTEHSPGTYAVEFDGSQFTSGLYFYVLTTPEGELGRKMMLLK